MIITKKTFDFSEILDKTSKIRNMAFGDIKVSDLDNGNRIVNFNIYSVEKDKEIQVPKKDENGDIVMDANGDIVYETKIIDEIKFYQKGKPYYVKRAEYDAIFEQIKNMIPAGLTRSEQDDFIKETGLKLVLINKGYAKGVFKSLNDFE